MFPVWLWNLDVPVYALTVICRVWNLGVPVYVFTVLYVGFGTWVMSLLMYLQLYVGFGTWVFLFMYLQ